MNEQRTMISATRAALARARREAVDELDGVFLGDFLEPVDDLCRDVFSLRGRIARLDRALARAPAPAPARRIARRSACRAARRAAPRPALIAVGDGDEPPPSAPWFYLVAALVLLALTVGR